MCVRLWRIVFTHKMNAVVFKPIALPLAASYLEFVTMERRAGCLLWWHLPVLSLISQPWMVGMNQLIVILHCWFLLDLNPGCSNVGAFALIHSLHCRITYRPSTKDQDYTHRTKAGPCYKEMSSFVTMSSVRRIKALLLLRVRWEALSGCNGSRPLVLEHELPI